MALPVLRSLRGPLFRRSAMFTLNDDELRIRISQRLVGAEEVRERIGSLFGHRAVAAPPTIYHVKSRVKTAQSIFEKIQDRRLEYPERGYGLGDVGDIIGFRLLTLFDDSLFDLFLELKEVIELGQKLTHPVFRRATLPGAFNDCCVFAQNDSNDNPYVVCHGRIKQHFGLGDDALVRREIRKNGYSSIHIQLDGLLYRENHVHSIPVEFQLRTALEDTWAEISHQLQYKKRYDRLINSPELKTAIRLASDKLVTFKFAIDEATRQASDIRRSYVDIDGIVEPIARYGQIVVDPPVSLALIAERFSLAPSGDALEAANDLHSLLNRIYLDRAHLETGREDSPPLPALRPVYDEDPRWRRAEEKIKDLKRFFDRCIAEQSEPDETRNERLAAVHALLDLESLLFGIRLIACRIAQMRREKQAEKLIGTELSQLRTQADALTAFIRDADTSIKVIGHSACVFAAYTLDDSKLIDEHTSSVFGLARATTGAGGGETARIFRVSLCFNALANSVFGRLIESRGIRPAAMAKDGPERSQFVRLMTESLDDLIFIVKNFYDPAIVHKPYVSNAMAIGNNILMLVVELFDVGVDPRSIMDRIDARQISNFAEVLGKNDVDPEYRGDRLHTLCGVYRLLKRPEQWKRAVRELRDFHETEGNKVRPELLLAIEEELARKYQS
jgi:ppGpp synthetase/RelA/SpoT-type nucleotidyltranferase